MQGDVEAWCCVFRDVVLKDVHVADVRSQEGAVDEDLDRSVDVLNDEEQAIACADPAHIVNRSLVDRAANVLMVHPRRRITDALRFPCARNNDLSMVLPIAGGKIPRSV